MSIVFIDIYEFKEAKLALLMEKTGGIYTGIQE